MVEFKSKEDVEQWLKARPEATRQRDAVALAARAALRTVPHWSRARKLELTTAILRATALARVAAVYPTRANELRGAAAAASFSARTSASSAAASSSAASASSAAASFSAASAADYAAASFSAASSSASSASSAADYAAASAASAAARTSASSAARAAASNMWKMASTDASLIEAGRNVMDRALWLQPTRGAVRGFRSHSPPDWASTAWRELKTQLLADGDHWQVWIDWYEAILKGKSPYPNINGKARESLEMQIALLPDELWKQGPKAVNTEIKRLIEVEHEKQGVFLGELPSPAPATRFAVSGDKVDVLPTSAWQGQEKRADAYRARALALAGAVASRLERTNALPDLSAAVAVAFDRLSEPFDQIDPDLLRLDARPISALARAMGHSQSEWTVSDPQLVAKLFELAEVMTSLLGFVRGDVEKNEEAIRRLDLTEPKAREAKETLDQLDDLIAESTAAVTERTDAVFAEARQISDAASDVETRIASEAERLLLAQNLARAMAQHLRGHPGISIEGSPGATVIIGGGAGGGGTGKGGGNGGGGDGTGEEPPEPPKKPRRTKRKSRPRGQKSAREQLAEAALKGAVRETEDGTARLTRAAFDALIVGGEVSLRTLAAILCYKLGAVATLSPDLALTLACLCFFLRKAAGDDDEDDGDEPDAGGSQGSGSGEIDA